MFKAYLSVQRGHLSHSLIPTGVKQTQSKPPPSLSSHPDTLRRHSGVASVYGGPSCWSQAAPCPAGPRVCELWLSPACSTQMCFMQGLSEPPALPSLPLPRSLARSLSSSHTSPNCAPPTSSGIHSKKTQASWQRAQTTLLKKERESMKKRQSEGGEQGEREGYPERKEVVKVRGKLREGGGS